VKLKNADEYIDSLRKLDRKINLLGEKVQDVTSHKVTMPHVYCAAMTYELGNIPEFEPLLYATSHLTGKKISRFTHIHQSTEDLVKKVKMMRLLGQKTGACFQRCVGFDGINAVYSVTYEIDKKYGTNYHDRFKEYLKYIQEENLMVTGAMTDAKGDRSLRPAEQKNRDVYLHIVEKKKNGIIVRGAKLHQTGSANSHEILVMPTLSMREDEKDFSVSFAIPVTTKGLKFIFGRQMNDSRRLEGCSIDLGSPYGAVGGECMIVFDDVFVPEERVFMAGENEFTGVLVDRFASAHRCNYGACKVGLADVLIGATALVAEYLNIDRASHVKDKLAEMIHLTETLHSSALACAYEGTRTPSGAYIVNPLYANVTKLNVTRYLYEIARLSHDIAGGFVATLPSEKDLTVEGVGNEILKYLTPRTDVPPENRIRIGRLIENLTGPTSLIEAMHGAGSPQAQKVMIQKLGGLEYRKELARTLAGIKK